MAVIFNSQDNPLSMIVLFQFLDKETEFREIPCSKVIQLIIIQKTNICIPFEEFRLILKGTHTPKRWQSHQRIVQALAHGVGLSGLLFLLFQSSFTSIMLEKQE
jgi:hypothetical protein